MIRIRPLLKIIPNNLCYSITIKKNKHFIKIATDENTNLTTLTLNRPPVNGLNLDLLKELYATFSALEDTKPKGVIITSVCVIKIDYYLIIYWFFEFLVFK